MFPYIFLLIIIVGCFLQYDCNSKIVKGNNITRQWFLLVELLLISFAALSFRVGCDTNRYYELFKIFPTLDNFKLSNLSSVRLEPLWVLLNMTVRTFTKSFYPIYAIGIIIINIQIFTYIRRYCKMPFLAILLYYSIMYLNLNFEMIRQDYAMIFYFWGIFSLLKGNLGQFILKAFPSLFFHKSAILIYLITIFVYCIKIKNIYCWLLIIVYIGSSAIKSILPQVALILDLTMIDPSSGVQGYLMGASSAASFSLIGLISSFFGGMLIPLILLRYYDKKENQIFKKLLFAYLIIMSIYPISPIIYRLAAYVQVFYFICLCNFISPYIKARRKTILSFVVCGLTIVLLSRYYLNFIDNKYFDARAHGKNYSGDIRYVPYTSIFENTPNKLRADTFSDLPT